MSFIRISNINVCCRISALFLMCACSSGTEGAATSTEQSNNSSTQNAETRLGQAGTAAASPTGAMSSASGSAATGGTPAQASGSMGSATRAAAGGQSISTSGNSGAGGVAASAGGLAASGAGTGGSATAGAGPGVAGAAGNTGMAGTTRPLSTTLKYPTMKESPQVAPYFNIYRPSDLAVTGEPFPVVAWANGGCVRGDDSWISMFERWAGTGIVVLALTASPTGTLFDMSTVDDQRGLVDWIVAENAKESSPYFGKLDTSRIAAAGNSCGAVTALQLAAMDSRVSSVFVLSGGSQLPGATDDEIKSVVTKTKAPVIYIEGSEDDVSRAPSEHEYDLYDPSHPVAYVTRSTGDHPTISADPAVLVDAAEITLNWFDLSFWGNKKALDVLMSKTVCETCMDGVWTMKSKNLETLVR